MRVLLDEHLPVDLVPELQGHDVDTVVGRGWAGVKNSELLRRVRDQYNAFITMDRAIEFQQNIPALPFGVILVRPLVPAILDAIAAAKPGRLQRVGA